MKTIIYVDGFNLYYGCLKHSADKWLDIYKLLFEQITLIQEPKSNLICIKFFTADIKTKIATNGIAAHQAQNSYIRALQHLYPNKIQIIKGYFSLERANLLNYQQPPDKAKRTLVWKLEEKQSDVSIALESYRDAIKENAKQLIFVSSDSDLAPSLKAIREDLNESVQIGIILPIKKINGKITHRPDNKQLSYFANWTRRYISDIELSNSHLPDIIPTRKKAIRKPDYW